MSQRHRLLIVDDDPEVLLATKMCLKRARYQGVRFAIATASSGQEAVETMRQDPSIAVVIIDQIMEEDTAGLEACRRIRQELGLSRPRLILRSGLAMAAEIPKDLASLSLTAVLPKGDMNPENILQQVTEALDAYYALSS